MMIKPELVRNIAKKFKVGETEAADFVDNIFISIAEALRKGKNINIPEFGKFKIINKTKDGKRFRYVSLSPVRHFADSINENFNNLEPQITKSINLKKNEILTIREYMPDENDEELLHFIFDDEFETPVVEDIRSDINTVSDSRVTEYTAVEKTTENSFINKETISDTVFKEDGESDAAFELPEVRKKIIHDLKDDFSIEDLDTEITGLVFKKEEILKELETSSLSIKDEKASVLPEDDIIIPSRDEAENTNEDDIIIPLETAEDRKAIADEEEIIESEESSEEVTKSPVTETSNVELRVFQKLLSDQPSEQKDEELLKETVSEPDVITHNEPTSLTEALDNLQNENVIQPLVMDDNKDAKSFNEIFVTKEPQYGVKPALPDEKKKPLSVFMKVLIYVFLIAFAVGISFYLYKTLFDKLESNGIIENLRLTSKDTLTNQFAAEDDAKGESVLIEEVNGISYRKIGTYVYIENNVCENIGEASDKEAKLKSNLVSCRVEGFMTLENSIKYRVLVGPFENLEIAKRYNEENKSVLNSLK